MLSNSRTIFDQIYREIVSVYDSDEARSIVFLILEEKLGIKRTDILTQKETDIPNTVNLEITQMLERIKKHEPVQYILGKTRFYGLELKVDHRVLIPRQETEELVDWIIKEQHAVNDLLDIGTGSGCIAISLARGYLGKNIVAWDHSVEVLALARENSESHKSQIEFQKVDIMTDTTQKSFDLIVSNPPYIPLKEKGKMSANVIDYEPDEALFVKDDEPLIFYQTICELTKKLLRPQGWLYFEINETFGDEVIGLMGKNKFGDIQLKSDLNNKPRMVRGRKK